jgi:2-dehydro-3-deoxygluconokinase
MTRMACLGECMIELSERPDGTLTRGFGGDTLNTAVYLARLGVATDYVTVLGTDPFSAEMLAAWTEEGVGTHLVLRSEAALPGLYMIQTDAAGERRFSYWRDAAPVRRLFDHPGLAQVEAGLASHDLLHLSGISLSLFGEAGRPRLFELLDRLRAGGTRISFDTNFRPRGWPDIAVARDAFALMLDRSDIVLAGVEDYLLLWGDPSDQKTLDWAHSGGAPEVVVKHLRPGCLVSDRSSATLVPTTPAAVLVDTTAAGDSFAAGYLAARATGGSLVDAAIAAHRLAGRVVQHRGAIIPRAAMPAAPWHPTANRVATEGPVTPRSVQ